MFNPAPTPSYISPKDHEHAMTTEETPSSNFTNLYPEIDPETPIRLSLGEHFAIIVSTGILVFGAASGDLITTGVGFGFFLFTMVVITMKTKRRIRHEARSRFPGENWAEYRTARHLRTDIIVPVAWLIICTITGACLWYVPAEYTYWGAAGAAAISCLIMLFLPGLSPWWGGEPEMRDFEEETEYDTNDEEPRDAAENPHTAGAREAD